MDNFQKNPVKIYVQDIFRAKRTENKYIFNMFNITFKNVMVHGVITTIYNLNPRTITFELSDPTGCVQVYYDSTKNQTNLSNTDMKDLISSFASVSRFHDENNLTMSSLINYIECKHKQPINLQEGSYVRVIGDIFTDDLKGSRMLSAFICKPTSIEHDLLWMKELQYLYRKYYLTKESVP